MFQAKLRHISIQNENDLAVFFLTSRMRLNYPAMKSESVGVSACSSLAAESLRSMMSHSETVHLVR